MAPINETAAEPAASLETLELRSLNDYISSTKDAKGVSVYTLPPTTTSDFRLALGSEMWPRVKADVALLLLQHSHLKQHNHPADTMVLIRHVGANDESLLGMLTGCGQCIDLWHVLDNKKLRTVEATIYRWEDDPGTRLFTLERAIGAKKVLESQPEFSGPAGNTRKRGNSTYMKEVETFKRYQGPVIIKHEEDKAKRLSDWHEHIVKLLTLPRMETLRVRKV